MVYSSGLVNSNKGWGTEYDTTNEIAQLPYSGFYYTNNLFNYLYRESWACRRVVDYYPHKMLKGWGHLGLDDDEKKDLIEDTKLEFNKLKRLYCEGQKTANLHGDAYVFRIVNDGRDPSEPINWKDVREVEYTRVLSNREVEPCIDYNEFNYYEPQYYEVSVQANPYLKVHSDRIIRFKGNYLPPEEFERNNYCYASVLETFYKPYIRMEQSISHVAEAMSSFEFVLFGIEGLIDALSSADNIELENIKKIYKDIQKQFSSNRGIAHDKDQQTVTVAERKFTNIDKVIEEIFRKELIAASGLTKTQLYNEHPKGMNSTGKSDLLNEANRVEELQELKWRDLIDFDTKLIMAKHKVFEGYYWNFESTYQPTREEELKNRKTIAETDKLYSDMGEFNQGELRQRFTGSEYQEDLVLDPNVELEPKQQITNNMLPEPEKEEKQDGVEKFKPFGAMPIESNFAPIDVLIMEAIEEE